MNGKINVQQKLKIEYYLPFVFGFVLFLIFGFYDQTGEYNLEFSEILTCTLLLCSSIIGFFLYKRDLLNTKTLICLIAVCGFAFRLGYAIKIGYWQNQHDVESLNSSGHLSYIYYIFNNFKLPDSNEWQFSHPPLHHILSAVVVCLGSVFGFTFERSFENIQLLTVFYSSISMLLGIKICGELGVKGKVLVLCSLILAFFPGLFILAGSINNDILMITFVLAAMLYLVKWYKSLSVKSALICGLFTGLAMMTKVSATLFAVAAAITVIIKFLIDKDLKFNKVLLHALLFVAVLLPLGLWHPIRNFVLFQQPFGYVAPIPITNPLYNGDISLFERIILPFSTTVTGVYVDVWTEHNLWSYILRNSLFGEYNFGVEGIAIFTVIANLCLISLSLISLIILQCSKKSIKNILPIIPFFVVLLSFFVYFNIEYPFGCSMDFRYIAPLFFIGVVFLGLGLQKVIQCNKFFEYSACISTVVLCLTSVIIFI